MVLPILVPETTEPTKANGRMPRAFARSAEQSPPFSKPRMRTTTVVNRRIVTKRELAIARVLTPLGTAPLTRKQAEDAGKSLGIHWATVYRLRRRFLANPVASALIPFDRGRKAGPRLEATVEEIVSEVLTDWLPRQGRLAHPLFEIVVEIQKRCAAASVTPPSKSTISRRWTSHRKATASSAKVQPPLSKSSRVCKTAELNMTGRIATERERAIVRVLRPLGAGPLSRQQAEKAGKLLGIHWATVYHLRRRFLAHPVASALIPYDRGPKVGNLRLVPTVEVIVSDVLTDWLPRQRHLEHPLLDLCVEIQKRCVGTSVSPPSRATISRRWAAHRQAEAESRARVRVTESTTGGIGHGLADPCVGAV
ncbi:hypothetical protein LMG26411_08038 [Cupriavidus numazuensis]|uniref:Transposase n=1 Tax=Cupriavidus numazuensis TaxID=221992 RepID=A0ABN7QEX9_9BURK|nr:hypothetical protein LMG26411_08038 [Cupriavidus numazuensis]